MNEFFVLLFPWQETPNDQISDIFVYGILLAFIILLAIFLLKTIRRARLISSLANQVNQHGAPARPEVLPKLKEAFDRNIEFAEAWQEFENSLITRQRQLHGTQEDIVYKTDEASLFFSEDRLLEQHLNLRFWNSVPALLVGVGILGTFVGLVWGLIPFSGIDFAQTSKIQEAIKNLLSGVSTAFVTSVWGMLTSLLFNGLEKWRVGSMSGTLADLQQALDQLFTLTTQEEISFRQEDELAQQTQALKSFSTDLADRIKIAMDNIMSERLDNLDQGLTQLHDQSARSSQEIVQELHNVPEALGDAIAKQLEPTFNDLNTAVEELRREKEESSTDAIQQLVEEFQKSLSGSTTTQMETLAETVGKASESLITLPEQLASMMVGVQEQVNQTHGLLSKTSQSQAEQMKNMMEGMLSAFQEAIDTHQAGLSKTTDSVNEEMKQIANDIRNLLESAANRTDAQLAKRMADIETTSAQSLQAMQTMITELQQALTQSTAQTTEESSVMITRMRELLESSANRTNEQLAQRMVDMKNVSAQSIQMLQTTIEELQASMTSTASQVTNNSEAVTNRMNQLVDQSASHLESIFQTGQVSVGELLKQQSNQIKEVNAQMDTSRETLEKGREMLKQMETGVTSAYELVATTRTLSDQLVTAANTLEDGGERLMEASDTFSEETAEYLTANRETIKQIQSIHLQSLQLLNDFSKRFETIDAGLKSIFEEIEDGLTNYSTSASDSINTYLNQFSEQLTQASTALAGSVSALDDSVEELTDMADGLTRQRGNR